MHDNTDDNAIVPRYAFRLCHLKAWHVVEAQCGRCGHTAVVEHSALKQGRHERSPIDDIERKLWCTVCRNRYGNFVRVNQYPYDERQGT